MKALIRYSPLLILAIAWELAARFELVSTTALPPLSDVILAWIDMIKDGELITNGGSSLLKSSEVGRPHCCRVRTAVTPWFAFRLPPQG